MAAFFVGFAMSYLSHANRIAICQQILLGKEEEAFAQHSVAPLDQALLRRRAYASLRKSALRDAPFKSYFTARISEPLRPVFCAAALILISAVFGLAKLIPVFDPSDARTFGVASAAAGLLAVCAAAFGWVVAAWMTYRNARVQHTLTFVASRYSNDTFSKNAALFNDNLRGRRVDRALITELMASKDETEILTLQAVRYMVNYFEFIAVGVICGDLDEQIVRKTLRGNLIHYADRCMPWILELQADNPQTLEHLVLLRDHLRDP